MTPVVDHARLVDGGDLDELVRQVERLCDASDWGGLIDLRQRCHGALERGRQLWPIASLVEYRLALHAPPAQAAAMVREGLGRFAPGPLSEVVAAGHPWSELAAHLPASPLRAVVAQERVVRGEALDGVVPPGDLPHHLTAWEPAYPLAAYRDDGVDVAAPDLPLPADEVRVAPRDPSDDLTVTAALLDLVRPWTADSEGVARAVAVVGGAEEAIATVHDGPAHAVEVRPAEALAYVAWTGASGGAHGRRRGAAAGRHGAWWAAAALAGLDEDWPPAPDELGEAIAELRWVLWAAAGPATGWRFHLAVEDPADGLAWAIAAHDAGAHPGPP